ncbi:DNA ligase 4 [Thelephora terrestris]|uniref:DNA ligase n=1 Tax=Thelephora terrestris TaxID=56493 RepID=A0A9P6HGM8_9AGAM|nr:DNA ligase 4 [Thelephora terrestris]
MATTSTTGSHLSYPTSSRAVPTEIGANVPPENKETAPFSVLSSLFDRLQGERKSEKRHRLLNSWFNHWRREKGYDLYPVLRLILPYRDKERSVYGLKEKNLAKAYIRLIPLGSKDPDAIRLLQWKRPTERLRSTSGDFPSILHEVIGKRSSVIRGTLTIDDLNRYLDEITENIGKQENQSRILQKIYNRATPDEQRWIIRIILKDMNISVKDTTVFGVFHPDAQDLYNTCSDLKKVAWGLWDPNKRLGDEGKKVHLFRAFAPMLCRRPVKLEESVREMQGKPFIIEEKLDGERMQLHKRGDKFFYCSRKGKDYTYLYGAHVGTGSLTPFIASAFDPRVDEIILDGEMLVWDPISGRNLPFGTLKTAALDKSRKEYNPRPCFKVFDLLYLNGQSLLHKSCKFRKRNLRTCFTETQGRIELVSEFQGETAKDVKECMEIVMEARGEGLILKHPDGEYVLNGRNKDWIKVKPEYMDNMGETADLIVLGGEYGKGKRGGGVSTLLVGVFDDRVPVGFSPPPRYSTFVWIGSGLSYADLVWIRSKPWKEFDINDPPSFLQTVIKTSDDKPDVYLEPKDSFLLRVKAAEITPSVTFHAGLTMRFPRALAIRDDLDIGDCLTASVVLDSVRSDRKRKMSDESPKQGKKRKVNKAKPLLMPEFASINLKDVQVESDMFEGLKFLVSPDPKSRTAVEDKRELMKLVKAHGGTTSQLATNQESLFVVYSGTTTPFDIKRIIEKTEFDIIRPQWIHDCVRKCQLVPLRKKYFFHAPPARLEDEEYDLSDSEDESVPRASTSSSSLKDEDEIARALATSKASGSELESEHSEWFKVGPGNLKISVKADDSETEEDNDSDNHDLDEPDAINDEDDEWFSIPKGDQDKSPAKIISSTAMETQRSDEFDVIEAPQVQDATAKHRVKEEIKMGEADSAMQYDQDMIFRHLCFYVDSPSNARANGMQVKPNVKNEAAITEELEKVQNLIISNGGRIAGLDEPKLTHIVVNKRDTSRRLELMKRTSEPKRRYLVVSEFITACLEESTLLDEEEFVP